MELKTFRAFAAALVLAAAFPAIGLAQADPLFLTERAGRAVMERRYDAAIADLDEAIRVRPGLAAAYGVRGVAYQQKRDLERALADYDTAIRLEPSDAAAYMNRGNLRVEQGRSAEAIPDYERSLELRPQSMLALMNLAMAHRSLGDYPKTLARLDHAYRLKKEPRILVMRGETFEMMGQPKEAIAAYDRALGMHRRYAYAYAVRAGAYLDLGDYDQAMTDYAAALRIEPDDVFSLNNRCWAQALAGRDLQRAAEDCERAVALAPDDAAVADSRAFLLLRQGDLEGAAAEADRSYGLMANAHALFVRAAVRQKQGRTEEAKGDLDRALTLDPKVAAEYPDLGLPLGSR